MHNKNNKSCSVGFTHHTDEIRMKMIVNQLRKELNTANLYSTSTGKHDFIRHNG